jgi:hypothetical protein
VKTTIPRRNINKDIVVIPLIINNRRCSALNDRKQTFPSITYKTLASQYVKKQKNAVRLPYFIQNAIAFFLLYFIA